ncbi:ankyrin-1-like [Saccostrea echinata]|uniref:ankyrin-1-like n=1 Tax=Saccostrea echinata TaxID=191078 RepID=UPI002A806949|nr:ankyrin-1-like [Saccostrea echinata]
MTDGGELRIRDRSQDKSCNGFEKREKRRRIRRLQDAIIQKDQMKIQELLEEDFEVDFQYRGQTALQLAVKEGEYKICKKLVEKGANVNVSDAQKNSVLNTACWKGLTDIVKLLVKSGADLNAQNDHESTPLYTAAYKGHLDIVSVLVDSQCDLDLPNAQCQSPLHAAVRNEHVGCVQRLVDAGCDINFIDTDFKSPLMVASEFGFTEVAKILLDKGAKVNLKNRSSETAILLAANEGHSDIIKELANHGADVNLTTTSGKVPLIEAISGSHWNSATALIQARADVNQIDKHNQAPIHAAIRQVSSVFGREFDQQAMEIVKELINRGADINKQDSQGWTPLYQSAFAGNLELSTLMLDQKADVNIATISGDTVLHAGVYGNNNTVVDLLIAAGCRVNEVNKKGESSLFSAILSRVNIKIVKALINAGSSLDMKEKSQQLTSLHEAIIQHYTEAALLLINSGCDVNARNARGQTPLYTACEKGNVQVVEQLLSLPTVSTKGTKASTIPLHVATVSNFSHIVQQLIDANCDIHVMNEKGMTPIMSATNENSTRVAKILIKNGCDLESHCREKKLMVCCLLYQDSHPHFELEPLFLALTHKNIELINLYLKCYSKRPGRVIKLLSNILRTSQELMTHFSAEEKKEILEIFSKSLKTPLSLQEICRCHVRQFVRHPFLKNVETLPVASKLKDYITMEEVLSLSSEDEEEELKNAGKFTFVGRHMPYEL